MSTNETVTLDANDSEFLAHVLKMYVAKNDLKGNQHLVNLHAQLLSLKVGC